MDVRSYRVANIDSDHILIRSRVRFRMCKNFFQKKVISSFRPDLSKLKEQNILNEYKHKLSNNIGPNTGNIKLRFQLENGKGNHLKHHKRNYTRCRTRNDLFDGECRKATEEKNKAYLLMLQKHRTRTSQVKYKELRKVEEKVHRRKKMAFLEDS